MQSTRDHIFSSCLVGSHLSKKYCCEKYLNLNIDGKIQIVIENVELEDSSQEKILLQSIEKVIELKRDIKQIQYIHFR